MSAKRSDEWVVKYAELERRRQSGEIGDEEYEAQSRIYAKQEKAGKGCSWMLLGLVALPVVLIAGCVNWFNNLPESPRDHSYAAGRRCEDAVSAQMKSPGTAKFYETNTAPGSNGEYTTVGRVEAQNSFGGMVSYRFRCTSTSGSEGITGTRVDVLR